jgi:hypothetical protein
MEHKLTDGTVASIAVIVVTLAAFVTGLCVGLVLR